MVTIDIGSRVEIIGGDHWARSGVLMGRREKDGEVYLTVHLDSPLPCGDQFVVVVEEHVRAGQ